MNILDQNKNILQKYLKIFFLIGFLPIFVNIQSFSFVTEKIFSEGRILSSEGRILSINYFVIPFVIFFIYLSINKVSKRRLNYNPFLILSFSTLFSFIIFLFFKYQLNISNTSFFLFIQTITPLIIASFLYEFFNNSYNQNEPFIFLKNKEEILKYFAISILFISAILYFFKFSGSTSNQFGKNSILGNQFGPFYNFKGKRFFPILMANASIILIYLFLKRRNQWIYFVGGFFLLMCVVYAWSRTALITAIIGILILLFSFFTEKIKKMEFSHFFSIALIIFPLAMILFLIFLNNSLTGNINIENTNSFIRLFYGIFSSDSILTVSDESIRLSRIFEGMQLVLTNPLGLGFEQTYQESSINYSYLINIDSKNFISENGYIDFALKTGWIGIFILLNSLYKIHYFFKSHNYSELILLKSLFYSNIFSSIFLLQILTEPYSFFYIWFILLSCYFLLNFTYEKHINSMYG